MATSRESKHVVNVSSALAYIPRATEPAYVATNAGLIALSQSVRADWRGFGVGVSVVCPRVTNTAIAEHAVEGEETMATRPGAVARHGNPRRPAFPLDGATGTVTARRRCRRRLRLSPAC